MSTNPHSSMEITNLEQEKRKFLFDPKYNPQFEYAGEVPTAQKLSRYGVVTGEHLPLAEKILHSVLKEYGTEEKFVEQEGNPISRERTSQEIQEYLQQSGLQSRIKTSFSPKYVARTAVAHDNGQFWLRIRLPVEYREHNLLPILNHEIGTHVFRWLNEEQQPWHMQRKAFQLNEYMETEEGIAVLNAMISHPAPYLWMPALYYFTTYHAQFLSFTELAQKLKPFLGSAERRFKTCLRAKRGLTDTSQPGAFTKDQVYLTGTVKIARWLHNNHYNMEYLYIGKVALEDLERVQELSPKHVLQVPAFMNQVDYKKQLRQVITFNKLLTATEKPKPIEPAL